MLSETTLIDRIEINEHGHVHVRRATHVLRDGAVIATTFARHVLTPGDDLANEDPRVAVVARAVWTFDELA